MNLRILNTIGVIYSEEAKEILNGLGQVDYRSLSQDELEENISKYDVIVVGLGLRLDKTTLAKAKRLKLLATATTGLDHIDLNFANSHAIKVLSLRGEEEFLSSITSTSELALGIMINLARGLNQASQSVIRGEWNRENFRGHMLCGQTLGVLGLGRLGKFMAQYGASLGMDIIFTDPNVKEEGYLNYRRVSFDELLMRSDYVSIHVHLTPETEKMFNERSIRKMKPSAFLINTSRDKIVDEGALLDALTNNKLAGYGTDVLSGELDFNGRIPDEHPLLKYAMSHSNVIILPHIGGMTFESRKKTDVFIANKIKKHLVLS